jgi:hypothetical protein
MAKKKERKMMIVKTMARARMKPCEPRAASRMICRRREVRQYH